VVAYFMDSQDPLSYCKKLPVDDENVVDIEWR